MKNWDVTGETRYPAGTDTNPFGNKFYGYRVTDLVLPDGRPAQYHGLLVGDTVHVVAVDDDADRTTYLVRQARPNLYRAGQPIPWTVELPGGFAGDAPSLAEAAQAELRGEISREAERLTPIAHMPAYSGASDEMDHIFLAEGLTVVDRGIVEATEADIEIISGGFDRIHFRLLAHPEMTTPQTLAAISIAATRL